MIKRFLIKFVNIFYPLVKYMPVGLRSKLGSLYSKYCIGANNKILVKKINGINFRLDLSELIDSSLYYNGYFEYYTHKAIKKIVKKGMICFDIGANMGCHAFHMAKYVGENGKVYAFEPMNNAFMRLKNNYKLNNFDNLILLNEGFSNAVGKITGNFRTSRKNNGESDNETTSQDIKLNTIDQYVIENKINKIDFMKIDVDGFEYKIISGGIETLKKFKPIILIELGKYTLKDVGDNIDDLLAIFESIGYSAFTEENYKKISYSALIKMIPENATINVIFSFNDII